MYKDVSYLNQQQMLGEEIFPELV